MYPVFVTYMLLKKVKLLKSNLIILRVYSDRLRLRVYRYKLRHPNTTSRYLAQKFKISKTKARSIVTGKDYVIKKTYFL